VGTLQWRPVKLFYTDQFVLPLPEGHRFPITKYARLRQRAQQSGLFSADAFLTPPAATDQQPALAHDPEYVRRVVCGDLTPREIRRIGFPWSPELVERSRRSTGATLAAARTALDGEVAANLAGGTHHAMSDTGEGFCVFNDAAVTARVLQEEGNVHRVVVLDCDVHQGNGTAQITRGDDSIFTLSIHGQKNFPLRKFASDLDIALPDGTSDAEYLDALEKAVSLAIERSRPNLAIYLAGADPYKQDRFGRLALTKSGLAERDRFVLESCREAGIPVAIAMAGGYSPDVDEIVDIHLQTLKIALDLFA